MQRVFLTWFLTGAGLVLAAFIAASAAFLKSDAETSRASEPEPTAAVVRAAAGVTQSPVLIVTTAVPQAGPPATPTPIPTVAPSPTPTPAGPVVFGRPVGLAATVEGAAVVLTWQPVPGAYYNVYRSETPGGGSGAVYAALGSSGTPRFVDSSVQRGVTYYYVVTASGGGIESPSSAEASIRIP
jgi:hypothetical protein